MSGTSVQPPFIIAFLAVRSDAQNNDLTEPEIARCRLAWTNEGNSRSYCYHATLLAYCRGMIEDGFSVIFPAAGTGSRFGRGDKLMTDIGGTTVLRRSVALFTGRADVLELLVVTAPERFDTYRELLANIPAGKPLRLVAGGTARWESVLHGLRAASIKSKYVAIHDAARPLTPAAVIDAAFAAARLVGAGVPVVAEPATLKRVNDSNHIVGTVSRVGIFQAQTPQCFGRQTLLTAYEKLLNAGLLQDITDDATVFELAGLPVAATPGSPMNIKLTTSEDLLLAEALARVTQSPTAPLELPQS